MHAIRRATAHCGMGLGLAASLALPAVALASASSVYVQDSTTVANGGLGQARGAVDRLQQALTDANPCVDTADNQDVAQDVADARDQALQEGGDTDARLLEIGRLLHADILIGIQAVPAPGGGKQYSAFAMDAQTRRTLARAMGSEEQVVKSLVEQLGGAFAQDCKPHWVGRISFTGNQTESKSQEDGGPMLTGRRNVRRTRTTSLNVSNTMTAQLLSPASGGRGGDTPLARVVHRFESVSRTEQKIGGEQYCRVQGRNPFWEGFNESYAETVTMKGRATGTAPVHILVFSDGRYMIRVSTPGGTTLGSFTIDKSPSQACESKARPERDAQSLPGGTFDATGFDAEGRVDPRRPGTLSGSSPLPVGQGTMSWSLRLVKPRGP